MIQLTFRVIALQFLNEKLYWREKNEDSKFLKEAAEKNPGQRESSDHILMWNMNEFKDIKKA